MIGVHAPDWLECWVYQDSCQLLDHARSLLARNSWAESALILARAQSRSGLRVVKVSSRTDLCCVALSSVS